mmetsp:Transcript_20612/g.54209  ORF Transcript_20612/g.54209 Transcript_20612/m.54209 type:complete len:83 (+) Transcript_20612:115-363(+)|eukprot:36904-Prymnesium_polylepis.1
MLLKTAHYSDAASMFGAHTILPRAELRRSPVDIKAGLSGAESCMHHAGAPHRPGATADKRRDERPASATASGRQAASLAAQI